MNFLKTLRTRTFWRKSKRSSPRNSSKFKQRICRCRHCQNYGHSSKFYTAKTPTCGHCTEDQKMADCTSHISPPCCAICKSGNEAGHHSWSSRQAAVKANKHRMNLRRMRYHLAFAACLLKTSLFIVLC